MISSALIMRARYEKRNSDASPIPTTVVESNAKLLHAVRMFDTETLLEMLKARGIKNADIARAVGLPSPRITEMFNRTRKINLDEAKRIVEAFRLDEPEQSDPLSEGVARLLALHVANRVGRPLLPEDGTVQELAEDLQAFARFAWHRRTHLTAEATQGFFAGRTSGLPSRH